MTRSKRERSWLAQIHGPGLFGDAGRVAQIGLVVNQPLILEREPANSVDACAILVRDLLGAPVGYVQREVAARVAPVMDDGCTVLAKVAAPVGPGKSPHTFRVADALLWVDGLEGERLNDVGHVYRLPTFDELVVQYRRAFEKDDA